MDEGAITPGRVLAIRLDAKDNVATAMNILEVGQTLVVLSDVGREVDRVVVASSVPFSYHKVALVGIQEGAPVLKYGEIIGYATADIGRGEWAHTHNVQSASLVGAADGE
jgi:hypothetical protein